MIQLIKNIWDVVSTIINYLISAIDGSFKFLGYAFNYVSVGFSAISALPNEVVAIATILFTMAVSLFILKIIHG